jgi:hypothetical protein
MTKSVVPTQRSPSVLYRLENEQRILAVLLLDVHIAMFSASYK